MHYLLRVSSKPCSQLQHLEILAKKKRTPSSRVVETQFGTMTRSPRSSVFGENIFKENNCTQIGLAKAEKALRISFPSSRSPRKYGAEDEIPSNPYEIGDPIMIIFCGGRKRR